MKYNFKYQTKASDLWQLNMYNIYSNSLMVTVNITFTVAMALLTIKYWSTLNLAFRIGILAAVLFFVAVQPFLVYMKAKKRVQHMPSEIVMAMDDLGLHIQADTEMSDIGWKSVISIVKKPTLIVIVVSDQHGYVISNLVLGAQKEEVYQYVKGMINR